MMVGSAVATIVFAVSLSDIHHGTQPLTHLIQDTEEHCTDKSKADDTQPILWENLFLILGPGSTGLLSLRSVLSSAGRFERHGLGGGFYPS